MYAVDFIYHCKICSSNNKCNYATLILDNQLVRKTNGLMENHKFK